MKNKKQSWFYSNTVKEHFFKPKNIVKSKKEIKSFNAHGVGIAGHPVCGDVMKMWIKVDEKKDKVTDCKWQTFGCASAIASTSMLSVMITEKGGMPISKILKIKPKDIAERLGGLPQIKFHCSMLGETALRNALNDYFKKSGQHSRIIKEYKGKGKKVVAK